MWHPPQTSLRVVIHRLNYLLKLTAPLVFSVVAEYQPEEIRTGENGTQGLSTGITLRTHLKTGTKFSGFGTYHFWLVLILAILTSVLHNSDYQQRFVERRFEDATADILRRINTDHGEDEIVPEDEDSNSSSESDMEIV